MRHRGTITDWNDERGFGFVLPSAGGSRVFLHARALTPGQRRPRGSEAVTYELEFDERRRPRAANVRYEEPASHLLTYTFAVVFSLGFIVVLAVTAWKALIPFWVPPAYLVVSLVTVSTYRSDKIKAQSGAWRVSEETLHLLASLGGWPGALAAQQAFRHKNRKLAFQAVFWTIVIAHLLFWAWFFVSGAGGS